MIELRKYQRKAIDSIRAAWAESKRPLLVAATGTGKTEMALGALVHDGAERALFIAHRQELVFQPIERIQRHWQELQPAGVVMGKYDETNRRFIAATVQTLASNGRLDRIFAHGPVTHVVVDEAHHAVAPTYLRVLERLFAHNQDLRLLGVTATPIRSDERGLRQVFDTVAYRVTIRDAIEMGALTEFVAYAVEVPVSLKGVRETESGWDDEQVAHIMDVRNVHEVIFEAFREYGETPAILFTPSVAMAHNLAAYFRERGVPAEAADGTTREDVRRAIIERYKRGETQVIVNCALWTEGFDAPATRCVMVARPVKSDSLYIQMVGRGLRPWPGKMHCTIIDFAPQDARNLFLAGDLLGRPRKERKALKKARDKGLLLDVFSTAEPTGSVDADPNEIRVRLLDYLSKHRLQWTYSVEPGFDVASVGVENGVLFILTIESARPPVRLYHMKNRSVRLIGRFDDVVQAMNEAEAWVDRVSARILVEKKAAWRRKPATIKQEAFLRKLDLWRDGMSRGEASQAISHAMAVREAFRIYEFAVDNGLLGR